jgi:hypothetical protein
MVEYQLDGVVGYFVGRQRPLPQLDSFRIALIGRLEQLVQVYLIGIRSLVDLVVASLVYVDERDAS